MHKRCDAFSEVKYDLHIKMKTRWFVGIGFLLTLVVIFFISAFKDQKGLEKTVRADFVKRYPNYEFVDYGIGDGDPIAVYVHVKFKKPGDKRTQEEVWQYWDTENGWKHRDDYLKSENAPQQ
jgi:hypothetical protein